MRVTLKDVAERAGLSVATISQILNPVSNRTAFFAESTRAQVRQIAEEMGYRANTAARSTATGTFGAVALLLSHYYYRSLLPPLLLDGITHAAEQNDLHLIVSHLPDHKLSDPKVVPKLARELACDGLLVNYNAEVPEDLSDLIDKHRLPAVWINSKDHRACVHPDDFKAARDLTQKFIEAGHTRIAYVDYTFDRKSVGHHYSCADRLAGYEKAMLAVKLSPLVIGTNGFVELPDRVSLTKQWIIGPGAPSAVICYGIPETNALLETAARLRISMPHQLCLGTFHDQPVRHFEQLIPTALLPEFEIGYQTVKILCAHILLINAGKRPAIVRKALPMQIENSEAIPSPKVR